MGLWVRHIAFVIFLWRNKIIFYRGGKKGKKNGKTNLTAALDNPNTIFSKGSERGCDFAFFCRTV